MSRRYQNNLHVSDDLLAELRAKAADEGKTVDELAAEALRRHLAQRTLDRLQREASRRRGRMADTEVQEAVDRAIDDLRGH
ncbi:MAG: hypothetical protein LAP87_11050 [Acidobacteriia bacterium]|nr:hypothetical protein [Terriglobia bacterium]